MTHNKGKGNSLSQLIGHYNTDSEEENDEDETIINENTTIGNDKIISTDWTKCYVKNTGHPYYWNTNTRDVTWDIPNEYKIYLKYIEDSGKLKYADNQKYWSECKSDDSNEPYYVNKITRVVSWDVPEVLKKSGGGGDKKSSASLRKSKSVIKQRNRSNKFDGGGDIDEKIELITSYTEKTDSSSDDDVKKVFNKKTVNLLVPQYSDAESDNEKQSPNVKFNHKQLFPATNTSHSGFQQKIYSIKVDSVNSDLPLPTTTTTVSDNVAPIITPSTTIVNSSTTSTLTNNDDDIEKLLQNEEILLATRKANEKIEPVDQKPTLLLNDSMDFDVKTFKRKKRIEFLPQKPKMNEKSENGNGSGGEGIADDIKSKLYSNFKKSSTDVEFVGDIGDQEQHKLVEIKESGELIKSKLRFLSEGSTKVTSVQAMFIQYETLMTAYDQKCLTESYLLKWIRETSENLNELEKDAVPEGWKCEWDRQNVRYCYINMMNGKKQWDFPISCDEVERESSSSPPSVLSRPLSTTTELTAKENCNELEEGEIGINDCESVLGVGLVVGRGDDEMDICTTPPPPSEARSVDNTNAASKKTINRVNSSISPLLPTETTQNGQSDNLGSELESFYSTIASLEQETVVEVVEEEIPIAPPPPIISRPESPTPPPPPSIDASIKPTTTLKRDIRNGASVGGVSTTTTEPIKKKTKKAKVQGITSKMKDISGMVAKWQQVQRDYDN